MILAGDAPVNSRVQLMMASVDGIAQGAFPAKYGIKNRTTAPELALFISCIGRKLVMNQRVEEEIEHVREVITSPIAGFYSTEKWPI
jgi:hypothetical protein